MLRRTQPLLLAALACFAAILVHAEDWPQWRGPRRDAVSVETGFLRTWPASGPGLAWKSAGMGAGYSGVVVGQGRVYTIGRADKDVLAVALDEKTGQTVWSTKIGTTDRNCCSTPTLDVERLYALDPDGDLVCLSTATGEIVWQKSFLTEFAGRMMSGRGYGESPLIDGDALICTPGGPDAALVALDKRTGSVLWKSKLPALGPGGREGAGFSSVVVTQAAGLKQYVQLVGRGLVGIDARNGRFLWAHNGIANDTANIPTPIVQDEYVFAANGYAAGSVLLKLVKDAGETGVRADVVYSLTASQFQNHHGGVVRLGEHLFGGHGNNNGLPTCVEFKTGKVLWKRRGPGVGSAAVLAAEGLLYFRYQNGVVALLDASPEGYKLRGSFEIPGAGGDSWAHPALANGRLFLREQDMLWVYDVKSASGSSPVDEPALAPSASVTALRKLGVSVEPLRATPSARQEPRPPANPNRSTKAMTSSGKERLYEYADSTEAKTNVTPVVVVLTDAHLSPEGLLSEELLGLLKESPDPLILSFAGTKVAGPVLQQIEPLHVVGLSLEFCSRITDDAMPRLAQLTRLRVLVLSGTSVTHVGLKGLSASRNLIALDLEACDGVTDDACEPLGTMRQLKALSFKKSGFEKKRIGDAGLQQLKDLAELEMLNLYGNSVNDAGLAHLQSFKALKELNLSLLGLTDAGLVHLQPLTSLESLELLYSEGFAGPLLSDAAAASVERLTNLTTLNLTGAKLTDAGLARLGALKKLKMLHLVRTRVTNAGVEALQRQLPDCDVVR